MFKNLTLYIVSILTGMVFAHANAADTRGIHYVASEAQRLQTVLIGTVEDMRFVEIDERTGFSEATGAATGAALGGLLGSSIGQGKGKMAATVIFTALGAGTGHEVEEIMNTAKGIEFIITLNNGRTIAITQAVDEESITIHLGDRVRVVDGQNARIAKLRNSSSFLSKQQVLDSQRLEQYQQQQSLEQELQGLKLEHERLLLEQQRLQMQMQQKSKKDKE